MKKFGGVGFAKQIQEADLPSFLSELRRAKENGFTEQSIVFLLSKQIVNSERAGTPCEAKIFVLSSTHSF